MPAMAARLLVSLLVGLVVAAGVATASAAPNTPESTTIDLPPLHVGDEGRYITRHGDELRFRFDEAPWVAPNGTERRAMVLTQDLTQDSVTSRSRYWLEGSNVLAAEVDVGGGGSASWTEVAGVVSTYAFGFYDVFETRFGAEAASPSCGLVIAVAKDSLSSAGCGPFQRQEQSLEFVRGATAIVLSARLPVALQVRDGDLTWHLVAFHRGDGPLNPGLPGDSFPVSFGAGSSPAEAGLDHPFHLSSALLFARLPPSPLAAFFDSHPDAYLASASFREFVEPGQRSLVWTLVGSDGREHLAVEARQVTAQLHDPPVDLPVGTGLVLPAPPVPIIQEVPVPDRPYPEPGQWSATFATLASLGERWKAAAPPESRLVGINAYGFDVLCAADCTDATTETWIGVDRIRSRQEPELPVCPTVSCDYDRWVWVVERLAVRDDGLTSGRLHSEYVQSGRQVALGDGGDWLAGADPDGSVEPTAAAAWSLPTGAAAAGAGLLGVLSGVVCYLWPQLKGAMVGLWRPRAGHPTRERLVRLVASRPGIHFHELRRQSGLAAGTLRHHLTVLEKGGAVIARAAGGYKCYTVPGAADRRLAGSASALKSPAARRILANVVGAGTMSMGQAASLAGLAPGTTSYHVDRLTTAGLVTRRRNGRSVDLLPTPLASQALEVL